MDDIKAAPLRSLDDFLLNSARFQLPTFNDPAKWSNRIINNLLYYQSNYFVLAILLFLLVGIQYPQEMVLGLLTIIGVFAGLGYLQRAHEDVRLFSQRHPIAVCACAVVVVYFLMRAFGSVLCLLFGIALPMAVILLHASLRQRNIKNKIDNKIEQLGIKKSPMGKLLETIGFDVSSNVF